jgi:hypothetical protein
MIKKKKMIKNAIEKNVDKIIHLLKLSHGSIKLLILYFHSLQQSVPYPFVRLKPLFTAIKCTITQVNKNYHLRFK